MAQAQRMNAAQPKEAATNAQRSRSIICVQPSVWCGHRKWALLHHTTPVRSSRLSWCQNNRGTRAVAMGCLPHLQPGGHCKHPDVLCTRQMRSNQRSKAALHLGPDSFRKLSSHRTIRPPCGSEAVPIAETFAWGKHPMDFSGALLHSIPVTMSKPEMLKTASGRASRSGFHCFLIPALFMNRTPTAGFDVLGSLMVVSLSMGVVLLMRLFLAY